MNGLSKITDKILNEARKDAAETLSLADEKCVEIGAEYASRAEEIINSARASGNIVERNMILSAKVELIDKAFAKAESEVLNLPEEKYIDFLSSLLASTFMSRIEEKESPEPYTKKYEVVLCETDKERIGDKLIPEVKRKLVGKDALEKFPMLVLSSDIADINGGFILRDGNVEINNSVKSIFEALRGQLEAKVSAILFPDKQKSND